MNAQFCEKWLNLSGRKFDPSAIVCDYRNIFRKAPIKLRILLIGKRERKSDNLLLIHIRIAGQITPVRLTRNKIIGSLEELQCAPPEAGDS